MSDAEDDGPTYWLTRFVFLRLLGFVQAIAFLVALNQGRPLIGAHGLLPAQNYLLAVGAGHDSPLAAFASLPTLFWLDASDGALTAAAWMGLALALLVCAGFANVPVMLALWALYLSFVNAGQLFYGYGWEILLLETTFLAVFLVPLWRLRPFPPGDPPSPVVMLLLRWLLFRLLFGAGLIKLRGDPCWRDLTCMVYHYETQPIPNPLSPWLHQLPAWFHAIEVLFNHFVELVVPWMLFGPRRLRNVGGALAALFQVLLILSGNLSFLNWLTLAIGVACFDDSLLARFVPRPWRGRVAALGNSEPTKARALTVYALAVVVVFLSLNPVANMLSRRQIMNTSYDLLHLVNTYGAFGSIGRVRDEIVLQGTDDDPSLPRARWLDYEFKCKPGAVDRRPCIVSPYHYRIDWQMWFAAMGDAEDAPWLVHLVAKLLEGDTDVRSLLAPGPFQHHPPRFVRAQRYRYRFTSPGDATGAFWNRTYEGEYLPVLSLESPELQVFLARYGWSTTKR